MKKIISFLLVAVLAVGVMLSMVSCSGDINDGIYKCADGSTIEIDGNKMIMSVGETTSEFKYEVNENTLTYTLHKSNNEKVTAQFEGLDEDAKSLTLSFEIIDGGFKLDTKEYTKQ